MNDRKLAAAAANMAGLWWAERLAMKYTAKREALAAAVASRVLQALNGEARWDWDGQRKPGRCESEDYVLVVCDYEPKGLLASAVQEVFGDEIAEWRLFTSVQDLFPRKHEVDVSRRELRPKEGYGNWTAPIAVSTQR